MGSPEKLLLLLMTTLGCWGMMISVVADDAYRYLTWTATYGHASPLGSAQQVILINGKFPGPRIDCVTNDNIVLNLINRLDEPLLLTWNGIQQRKDSWQDGVLGTNCPIPPNQNYTYKFQVKDQIGTYTYFPSTGMHRAAGGFGGLNVYRRSVIPIPYHKPAGYFTVLIGDWYKTDHKRLRQQLDSGSGLGLPDGLLINGRNRYSTFTGRPGRTYMFRISNVGLTTTINFRIQGHEMKLVEVEGSHTIQNSYSSLDVHVGQSVAVLVTLNHHSRDYYIVASTRFTDKALIATGVLHYRNSHVVATGPLPIAPPNLVSWSMQQAKTFRWNLTANAARPNPQGSYHYGNIKVTKTLVLANSAPVMFGRQRYAVNGVSFVMPDTPLKLADYFNIKGILNFKAIRDVPTGESAHFGSPVVSTRLHDYYEIVFQNNEDTIQSWHLDGHNFWVVGMGGGQWSHRDKSHYNLKDALSRHTTQVYPRGWTAVYVSLDNQGMWNIRSAMWARQYLGQQLYVRVWTPEQSYANELAPPSNMLLCGKAIGRRV